MVFEKNQSGLHLLFVGNFFSTKGGNRCVGEELAEHLNKAGYRVITTSSLRPRLLRFVDMVSTVCLQRREYQVAYVEVFSGLAFIWAEAVCWTLNILGKPYILTLHGGNLPNFAQRYPDRVRKLLTSAKIVTVPSPYLLMKMEQYCKDIRLLPNPVNTSDFNFCIRKQPRPILIWLRAFHKIYNPTLAPRVIAQLVSEFPDITLFMVGPDKVDGSLQATQNIGFDLGLRNTISFPGNVSKKNVPEWLNKADIFINTTNVDNTPLSILEAMASGLCIVSTDVGGIPFLLKNEENALLVPPDDPKAMAHAVRRIILEPGLASKLSANARSKVNQFDWGVILPQWESVFAELIKNA